MYKLSGSVSGSGAAQSGQIGAVSVVGGGKRTDWTVIAVAGIGLSLVGIVIAFIMRRKP